MCIVGILGCYNDYSVKIISKYRIFCWFFLYFHLHHTSGKKFKISFKKINFSWKYDTSGKFQVVYITSYFTIAFWSWVVISDSLRNPCNFTISDFRDPTRECSWRPTLRSWVICLHFPKTSMPKVHSSTNRNFSSSRWQFFLSGPGLQQTSTIRYWKLF